MTTEELLKALEDLKQTLLELKKLNEEQRETIASLVEQSGE